MSQVSTQWRPYWYHWSRARLPFSKPSLSTRVAFGFSQSSLLSRKLHNGTDGEIRSLRLREVKSPSRCYPVRKYPGLGLKNMGAVLCTRSLEVKSLSHRWWKTALEPVKSPPTPLNSHFLLQTGVSPTQPVRVLQKGRLSTDIKMPSLHIESRGPHSGD